MKNQKKMWLSALVAAAMCVCFASCKDDDEVPVVVIPDVDVTGEYGIASDSEAGTAPVVTVNNVEIPNISAPYIEEGTNGAVGNISFTGIKGMDGNFLSLYGTGNDSQNIWMTIDGKAKALTIVNAEDVTKAAAKKGKADIVFLVDNSGSMSEEANALAAQVLAWSKTISEVVDCQFGCVGYGDNDYGVDGGMDLADITVLDAFLNDRGKYGTGRTYGFYGDNAEKLENLALSSSNGYYNSYYNECGALALHFADEQFTWRSGANRIYINFTDEPNQPATYKQWSVETLNTESELYNWNASKGTVHSVYSGTDAARYEEGGSYYNYNISNPYGWYEKPWAMSEYTGGITLQTDPYFTEFKLDDIEVTGAITGSYVLRFNVTKDLLTGTHTIVITIKDKNTGSEATKTFTDISFAN